MNNAQDLCDMLTDEGIAPERAAEMTKDFTGEDPRHYESATVEMTVLVSISLDSYDIEDIELDDDEGLRDAAENHLAGAMPFSIDILSVENYDVVEETLEA